MNKKYGPWIIKSRKLKYKSNWLRVYEDEVIRPDGKPGVYSFVHKLHGVSVLPIDNKGYVYLVEEFRYVLGRKSLETVSGAIDKGEKPLQTAKRELEEEIGLKAKRWISLGVTDPFTSDIRSPAYLFVCKGLAQGRMFREGTETMEVIKVKLEKAFRMVLQSKITHAQSCVLILKAYEYLKGRRG